MVESSNYLGHLCKKKPGLTEAIFLPYLTISDLNRLRGVSRAWFEFFNP